MMLELYLERSKDRTMAKLLVCKKLLCLTGVAQQFVDALGTILEIHIQDVPWIPVPPTLVVIS